MFSKVTWFTLSRTASHGSPKRHAEKKLRQNKAQKEVKIRKSINFASNMIKQYNYSPVLLEKSIFHSYLAQNVKKETALPKL
jgi:hypothetical protein